MPASFLLNRHGWGLKFPWFPYATAFRLSRDVIDADFFVRLAAAVRGQILKPGGAAGLVDNFASFKASGFDPARIAPVIAAFYEETSTFTLGVDANPNLRTWLRPLARAFQRHLSRARALELPPDLGEGVFSPLASSVELIDVDLDGTPDYRAWVRVSRQTGRPMIVGSYKFYKSTTEGREYAHIASTVPLPRGNLTWVFALSNGPDGELLNSTANRGSRDAGIYWLLPQDETFAMLRIPTLNETIELRPTKDGSGVDARLETRFLGQSLATVNFKARRWGEGLEPARLCCEAMDNAGTKLGASGTRPV